MMQINTMYEMMTRWDSLAQEVPVVVSRLQVLRSVCMCECVCCVRLKERVVASKGVSVLLPAS